MTKKIKIAELFCGPGGFALGAKLSKNFKHIWLVDNDLDSLKTIKQNMPDQNIIHQDVKKFSRTQNLKIIKKKYGSFDGLIFGFPCNDFSLVGKKKGFNGKFGGLYKYACKVLKFYKPNFFVAENVSNLGTQNIKSEINRNFKKILFDFKKLGYGIKLKKIKFEKFKIPQRRHRIIIIGFKKTCNLKNFQFPKENNNLVACKKVLDKVNKFKNLFNHEIYNHSEKIKRRLKKIKQGQNVWHINGLPNVKKARMSNIYKKLDPNKPAYTVTGSGGGGTHMYHYKFSRALTNRERATLQTFPKNYKFCGKKESVRRQIGMAVPPLGAKTIFDNLKKYYYSRQS